MSEEPYQNEIEYLENTLRELRESYQNAVNPIFKRLSSLYNLRRCNQILVFGGKYSTGEGRVLRDRHFITTKD